MAAPTHSDNRPRMFPFTRLLLAVLIPLGALGAAVGSALTAPKFEVEVDPNAIPPHELGTVVGLLGEADAIGQWVPAEAGEKSIDLLVAHLRANPAAKHWADLRRSGGADDVGRLNTALEVLAAQLPSVPPSSFQNVPDPAVRNRLREALRAQEATRREALQRRALHSVDLESAVASAARPGPPGPPSWWRRTVCAQFSKPINDYDLWRESAFAAVRAHRARIRELYARYQSAGRIREAELGRSGEMALVGTVSRYSRGDGRPVVWRNGSAFLDCDVSVKTAAEGQRLIRTTGVRLFEVPVTSAADGRAKLGWPPVACVVDEEKFGAFLRGCGFPARLSTRFVRARSGGTANDPVLTVAFRAESDDFPGWGSDVTIHLSAATAADLPGRAEEAGREALASLRLHAGKAPRIRGVRAQAREIPGGNYAATLSPPTGPEVTLRYAVGADGGVIWTGPDTLADAERITDWLVQQQPGLRPERASLRLEEVGVGADGELTGRLVLPPAGAGASASSVPWSAPSNAAVKLDLPPDRKADRVPADPPDPPASPTAADVRRAMEDEIRTSFPKVAPHTEVVAAGGQWAIGLRVGEWPALRLGPVAPADARGARAAVREALAPVAVRTAAETQWGAGGKRHVKHPRYGAVTATLTDWDPEGGKAIVACEAPLWEDRGGDLPVKWRETSTAAATGWELDDAVAGILEKNFLPQLKFAAERAFGGQFDFDREPGPDGRWLTLSPPSVRLSCRIGLPLAMFQAGAGGRLSLAARGVRLDRSGLHFPEGVRIALEGKTFATPLCALSDPFLTFQPTERGPVFGIGAKITPALLAGIAPNPDSLAAAYGLDLRTGLRLDNPWIHVVYCEAAGAVRFREVEFKLAGTVRVFNSFDMAHAQLTWTLPDGPDSVGVLTGHLDAATPPMPDLPPFRLDGDVRLDGSGLRATGILDLISLARARAALRFGPAEGGGSGGRRTEIALKARAAVLGATVDLTGRSDLRFRDYQLEGETRVGVDYLVGVTTLVMRVEVTPAGALVTHRWECDGRTVQQSFSAPSVDLLDELEIRSKVIAAHQDARANPFAAVREEETYLQPKTNRPPPAAADVPTAPKPEPKPGEGAPVFDQVAGGGLIPFDEPIEQDPAPKIYFKYFNDEGDLKRALNGGGVRKGSLVDGLILHKKDVGGLDHIEQVAGGYRTIAVDRGEFESRRHFYDCSYTLWPERGPDGGVCRGKLLIRDHVKERLRFFDAHETHLRIAANGPTFTEIDFTDRFKDITPLFNTRKYEGEELKRLTFNQALSEEYAGALAYGFDPQGPPSPVGGGYAFEIKDRAVPPVSHGVFVWPDDKIVSRCVYLAGPASPPESRTEALYRRLAAADIGQDFAWVVAMEGEGRGRIALLTSQVTGGGRKYQLRVDAAAKGAPFATTDERADVNLLLAAARRTAEMTWGLGIDASKLQAAYLGPRGLLAVVPDGLLLLPAEGIVGKAGGRAKVFSVSWDRFRDWPRETKAHLPAGWKRREERAELAKLANTATIAAAVLSDWEAERAKDLTAFADPDKRGEASKRRDWLASWGADPLGLLLGIADEKEERDGQ